MKVADILQSKGPAVKTVRPEVTALELSEQLRAERIGAMIVSADGASIDGIISERDTGLRLGRAWQQTAARDGRAIDDQSGRRLLPEDSIAEVMSVMTQRRIRHLPVKSGDRLVGIISSGAVLKHRLGEMQLEANVLRDYAIARR